MLRALTIVLAALLGASSASLAEAGINAWSTNGPESGLIRALAIDPLTPSTVYAGFGPPTGGSGEAGVFKSSDGGGSWSAINTGLPSTTVHAVAIDPQTPATLYAGTERGRPLFKSTDGGGSWSAISTGVRSGIVWALAIDPRTPTTLYAGAYNDGLFNVGSVFKSTDGGQSWNTTDAGLPGPAQPLGEQDVYALAIDPLTPTTVYAGLISGGVFKTTNGGSSWSPANLGLPGGPGSSVIALAIDPVTPSTLYAGARGVFKSTDGGGSWTPINSGLPLLPGNSGPPSVTIVHSIAIDPVTPTTLYAGTQGTGVFRSTDGGASWSDFNTGLANTNVSTLAIDPATPTTLYAGTVGSGVFVRQTFDPVTDFVRTLYLEVLGRAPDSAGLAAWVGFLRTNCNAPGFSIIGDGFFDSVEFRTSRPQTLNGLVTLLYQAFLGRLPEPGGLAVWAEVLREDRVSLATGSFIPSAEFQSLVPNPRDPAQVTPVVTRFYTVILGRAPDPGGLSGWVNYIVTTGDLDGAAVAFLTSAEFEARALTFRDYVEILYLAFLEREPDPGGWDAWESVLRGDLLGVINGSFVPSSEFQGRIPVVCGS